MFSGLLAAAACEIAAAVERFFLVAAKEDEARRRGLRNPARCAGESRETNQCCRPKCRWIFSFKNATDFLSWSIPSRPSSIEIQELNPTERSVKKILS